MKEMQRGNVMTSKDRIERYKMHYDKYEGLCSDYGVAWSSELHCSYCADITELKDRYDNDPALNNIPLPWWDGLASLFRLYHRVAHLSDAELVSMQKHAAVKLLEKTYGFSDIEVMKVIYEKKYKGE